MIYKAFYEAKSGPATSQAVLIRSSLTALFEDLKEQVVIDFGADAVDSIGIFITPVENPDGQG